MSLVAKVNELIKRQDVIVKSFGDKHDETKLDSYDKLRIQITNIKDTKKYIFEEAKELATKDKIPYFVLKLESEQNKRGFYWTSIKEDDLDKYYGCHWRCGAILEMRRIDP